MLHNLIGINLEGKKELLGLWLDQAEGASFWLRVLNELKNRGVQDILIAAVDGLSGFPDAIRTVFPKTEVQLCIVHMVRNSQKWTMPIQDWGMAMHQFSIFYGDRVSP